MDDPHDHVSDTTEVPAPPGPPVDSESLAFAPEPAHPVPVEHADPHIEPKTEWPHAAEPFPKSEESPMATNYEFNKSAESLNSAADHGAKAFDQAASQAQHGYTQAASGMNHVAEDAIKQGQAAFAQANEKTREVMDKGMKAMDEFGSHARGNADAWIHASKAATQGIETMVQQVAELSRKSFEQATSAMRTMAAARTPQDVFTAQNAFIKAQFDNFVGEYSKLTETVMKVSNEVIQPLQTSMTDAAAKAGDAVKGMMNTTGR